MATIEVRNNRSKDWFYLDNELLEVFGGKGPKDKGIGIHALGVYMVLAKYSNNDTQQSKPSYQTIANLLGVARNTVITAIKTLEKAGMISVEQRTISEDKKVHTTNIYTLKNIKAAKTIPASELPSARDALPDAGGGIGVVQEVNHPSAPEGRELDLSNYTNLNNTNSSMPPAPVKSKDKKQTELPRRPVTNQSDLIADYFARLINTDKDSLTRSEYIAINQLVSEGFTLDRCRAGIDAAVTGIRGRGQVVSSFLACVRSIRQLDPAQVQPAVITIPNQPRQKTQDEIDREKDMARWTEKRKAQMARWDEVTTNRQLANQA